MKFQKIVVLCLVVLLNIVVINVVLAEGRNFDEDNIPNASFVSGSGTIDDPYLIENVNQLQDMNENLTAYYALANDIDAEQTKYWNEGKGFKPIANEGNDRFKGSLDGRGHEIRNLYIDRSEENNVGLFGCIGKRYSGKSVNDIRLVDVEIMGNENIGAIAGQNSGFVNNSYATGNVSCSKLNRRNPVGGLIGRNSEGFINNSYFKGNVFAEGYIGGLVGLNEDSFIVNSYFNGYIEARTTSDFDYVGGLVGINRVSHIDNCYSKGYIKVIFDGFLDIHIGGLVGYNYAGVINNTYSTVDMGGRGGVLGGLVGWNGGSLSNSYSTGDADDSDFEKFGGLVGTGEGWFVKNSFWDIESSNRTESNGGTGKTTAEMNDIATFTDTSTEGLEFSWDFLGDPNDDKNTQDIWDLNDKKNDGYPFFTSEKEKDNISPKADAGEDITVLVDEEFTLNGSSSTDDIGITNYTWTWDGNRFYGQKITHSFSSVGKYQFTLNVTDAALNWDTDTVNVTVEDLTAPTSHAGEDRTVAEDNTVTLDGSDSYDDVGIVNYTWSVADEKYHSAIITHEFTDPGTYDVTLTVKDEAGNSDENTIKITVIDITDPTAYAGNDITAEVREEITLDASGSSDNVGIKNYEWNLDNGETKTGEEITHTYEEPGTYTVELTVTDQAGNTDTDTLQITVEQTDDGDTNEDSGSGDTPGFTFFILISTSLIALPLYYKKRNAH